MKLLQVCPYDLGRPGGVQRHILDLAGALARAGHQVTVVAPRMGAGPAVPAGVAFRPLGTGRPWRMHGTRFEVSWAGDAELSAALREFREASFDAAHFHTPWDPFMPWQLLRRLAGAVPRCVATFHDTPPPTLSGRLLRAGFRVASRYLSRRLHAAVAVSESSASHLTPRDGCPLVVLPPCIDLQPYFALPAPRMDERAPDILFVGRLEPRKGVLLLIEAFGKVRESHADARLVICGDGEQRPAATQLAARLGISQRVTFAGALDDAGRMRLLSGASVFCAPSPYGESYGLVIAEAMAAGLPVVAAANAGYRSVLHGEGAEGLVPPGDAAALARTLERMLGSLALRRRLSAWGRANAARADVAARLPEFLSLYASNGPGRG